MTEQYSEVNKILTKGRGRRLDMQQLLTDFKLPPKRRKDKPNKPLKSTLVSKYQALTVY